MDTQRPLLGDRFPDMVVHTTHGVLKLPDDLSGRWFVLFSHPGDFTPVCTTEFVAFQNRHQEFRKLDCDLIGLSIDQVFAHLKWLEWIREKLGVVIEFPLIADDLGRVAARLGLIHPNKGANTVRGVFIVDPASCIRAMLFYPQEIGRSVDEILRMIRAFQISDAHGVAVPADWPENDLIQDRVILPPPQDEKTARERLAAYEGYDWWFCHREVR